MPVYRDPSDESYPGPKLFADLYERASDGHHALEHEVTATLVWLLDRSPDIANAFLKLLLTEEQAAGLPKSQARARQAVTIRTDEGSNIFPDLSLDWPGREAQVLVEIKVDAPFHTHTNTKGEVTLQPDTYLDQWQKATDKHPDAEAQLRFLGTLTRLGIVPTSSLVASSANGVRAKDVRWRDLLESLESLLNDGVLEEPVGSIAHEYAQGLRAIAIEPASDNVPEVLSWGAELIGNALPMIEGLIPKSKLGNLTQPNLDKGYVGRYLRVRFMGEDVEFWLQASLGTGAYNGGESKDTLWFCERPDMDKPRPHVLKALRESLAGAGFGLITDAAGSGFRVRRDIAQVRSQGDMTDQIESVVEWISNQLAQAGFDVG